MQTINTCPADTAEGFLEMPAADPMAAANAVLDAEFSPAPRTFLGVELWPYSNAVRQLIGQLSEPTDANSFFQMIALRVVYDVGRYYREYGNVPGATHEAARRLAFRRLLAEAAKRDDYRVDVLLWLEELDEAQTAEGRKHINELFAAAHKTELQPVDGDKDSGNG
jgi:hypothetical protein